MSKASYYDQVYEVTQLIPFGRVSTYGLIADYLALGSARMVGWALAQSGSLGFGVVPAHRVVNRKGELTGRIHFSTPTLMQELLENEGIIVKNDKVENFDVLMWNPSDELDS